MRPFRGLAQDLVHRDGAFVELAPQLARPSISCSMGRKIIPAMCCAGRTAAEDPTAPGGEGVDADDHPRTAVMRSPVLGPEDGPEEDELPRKDVHLHQGEAVERDPRAGREEHQQADGQRLPSAPHSPS